MDFLLSESCSAVLYVIGQIQVYIFKFIIKNKLNKYN